jgi:acyl phosphate:glycerol-3-phosphate acyltransferase
VLTPIYAIWLCNYTNGFPVILISALLIWRHKENIQRLLQGKESKIK